ncbi:hypothetical protein TP46_12250 [Xanthomonas citri pv. aurantifolii]|nr:hypothetical protein TP46_12250 [Xanthomonas citri pv. aurantifolii]
MVQPCCVYIFTTDPSQAPSFVKIGVSKTPEARISTLQVGCPIRITQLRIIETPSTVIARAAEASIHQALKALHTVGEWFRVGDDFGAIDRVIAEHFDGRGWPERRLGFAQASAAARSAIKAREDATYKEAINRMRMDKNMAKIEWD